MQTAKNLDTNPKSITTSLVAVFCWQNIEKGDKGGNSNGEECYTSRNLLYIGRSLSIAVYDVRYTMLARYIWENLCM